MFSYDMIIGNLWNLAVISDDNGGYYLVDWSGKIGTIHISA